MAFSDYHFRYLHLSNLPQAPKENQSVICGGMNKVEAVPNTCDARSSIAIHSIRADAIMYGEAS